MIKRDASQHLMNAVCLLSCHLFATITLADGPQFIGRSGCATATCHGGLIGSGPAWNSSSSRWESSDPHRDAGNVLLTNESKRIVAALTPNLSNNDEAFSQVLQSRCTSCHAPESDVSNPLDKIEDFQKQLARGVSCESCHGPASIWNKLHTQPEWSKLNRFDVHVGMRDTESLLARVDNCARCHVGSRTADGMIRDMNHEMIAAGHPVLKFEMHRSESRLPPHWETSPGSLMGPKPTMLVHHAKAADRRVLYNAARLSTERLASNADSQAFELSEFDCSACHHQLKPRPVRDFAPSNGTLYWNSWLTVGNSLDFHPDELRFDRADFGTRMAILVTQSELRSQDMMELPDTDPIAFLTSLLDEVLKDRTLRNRIVSDAVHVRAWLNQFEIACEAANYRLSPGGSEQLIRLLKTYGIEYPANSRDTKGDAKSSRAVKWNAERIEELCKNVLSIANSDEEQGGK